MEPPAVTSCSVSQLPGMLSGNSNGIRKGRSEMTEYLQIDPFVRGQFEELPENFLDTISPQQTVSHGIVHQDPSVVSVASPQLASLTPMSLSETGGYTTLVSMGSQPSYTTMKIEPVHEGLSIGSHHPIHSSHALLEKSFTTGPAGLLSPLHIDSNRCADSIGNMVSSIARPNGRAAGDMLSSLRRPLYIKEEVGSDVVMDHHNSLTHHNQQQYVDADYIDQVQQQELERMANAETPPAVSNVELASTMIASLIGEPNTSANWGSSRMLSSPPPPQNYHSPNPVLNDMANNRPPTIRIKHDVDELPISVDDNASSSNENVRSTPASSSRKSTISQPATSSTAPATTTARTYSTNDKTDPLNAEIDDDIYIDTKDLCKRIAFELKQHSIPQAIFAERILCRSQGTLSDLLRNPKPWNKLKSGRETFRRMYNWVQQPLHQRLGILDMYKSDGEEGKMYPCTSTVPMMSPPTPAQNVRHYSRNRNHSDDSSQNGGSAPKRPRLVFTDIQKRTLQAIFKETQRPSREMQQTIAEHLRLDISTVANFFMNARRRSRAGINGDDEPAPYQQVRPITPPPAVSPPPVTTNTRSSSKSKAASRYRCESNHSGTPSSPEDCDPTSPVAAVTCERSPPEAFEESVSLADGIPNGHSSSPPQGAAASPNERISEHREPTAEEVKKGALTLSTMHTIPVAGNKITVKVEQREASLS